MSIQRLLATICAFLAYFIMSGMLAQAGLITPRMAEHFDLDIATVTARFSWYGSGVLVGSVLAVLLLEKIRVALVIRGTAAMLSATLVLLWLGDSFAALRLWLALAGALGGIALAAAAFVITRSYGDRMRASMLVGTDLSFSGAGIVMSAVVTTLLAAGAIWSAGYLVIAAVAAVLLLCAGFAQFPEHAAQVDEPASRLPIAVWICGLALFGYTLGQTTLMLWLPTILTELHDAPAAAGGAVVGGYWTGMAMGQIAVFFLVLVIPLERFLALLLLAALALVWTIPALGDAASITRTVFALGIASSGLLKLVISWASLRVVDPPPRLVSVLLMCATTGTALAPALSARIASTGADPAGTLVLGALGYSVLVGAVLVALALERTRGRRASGVLEDPVSEQPS